MAFLALQSEAGLLQAIERSQRVPVVLFKHSAACALSAYAYRELSKLTRPDDPPVYLLVVQASRSLSRSVEWRFGIRHESPQAIVLYEGVPIFEASHGQVTAEAVRQACRAVTPV
jgi:bacillithiol system protein YtxJ